MDKTGKETLKIMKTVGWYNNWLFSLIKKYIKGEILEVGAGIGNFTGLLSKKGKVTAIDINGDYLEELKKTFDKDVSIGFGNIEKGKYFFKDKKFDTIICLNVLEHIKDDKKALRNLCKLLKSKGKLVLLVPAHNTAYGSLDENLGHFKRYSKKLLLRRLKDAGFKIKGMRYLNSLGIIGWFLNARILKKSMLSKKQLVFFDKIARPFLLFEEKIELPFGLSILAVVEK